MRRHPDCSGAREGRYLATCTGSAAALCQNETNNERRLLRPSKWCVPPLQVELVLSLNRERYAGLR